MSLEHPWISAQRSQFLMSLEEGEKHLLEPEENAEISCPPLEYTAKPACDPASTDIEEMVLIRPRWDMVERSGISGAIE